MKAPKIEDPPKGPVFEFEDDDKEQKKDDTEKPDTDNSDPVKDEPVPELEIKPID